MDISLIFDNVGIAVEGAFNVLSAIFTGVANLVWLPANDGAGGTFTFLGAVLLTIVGAPLAFGGLKYLISLFKQIKVANK